MKVAALSGAAHAKLTGKVDIDRGLDRVPAVVSILGAQPLTVSALKVVVSWVVGPKAVHMVNGLTIPRRIMCPWQPPWARLIPTCSTPDTSRRLIPPSSSKTLQSTIS